MRGPLELSLSIYKSNNYNLPKDSQPNTQTILRDLPMETYEGGQILDEHGRRKEEQDRCPGRTPELTAGFSEREGIRLLYAPLQHGAFLPE